MTRHIQVAEVARLIRQVLSEAFPTVEFKLTRRDVVNSMSFEVSWTDGPNEYSVDRLVRIFGSKRWKLGGDTYYVEHIFEGEDVRFLIDYVFVVRALTSKFMARAQRQFKQLLKDEVRLNAFLDSIHYTGAIDRDNHYLTRMFARTIADVQPRASVTATALLMANPFLHEEP